MLNRLDADGLEIYEGFLTGIDAAYLDSVGESIHAAGFAMPMLCCSSDFTNPSPSGRKAAIEKAITMIHVARRLGGPGTVCRVLSGQRYPGLNREQGLRWVIEAIAELLPVAQQSGVILGLENHYKDGNWKYPEFAQKMDLFLEIVNAFRGRENFGVQYDPSNAIVAGDDPLVLLNLVADCVVSMHASDRYLEGNTTIEDLRQSDGTLGYASSLRHGVTGKGLNDYHSIFQILSTSWLYRMGQYRGWNEWDG